VDFNLRLIESTDWITYLMIGCFGLFALAKFYYPRRFQEFTALPITNKYFFLHGKNDELSHPFNLLFFVTQIICASIFIYLLFKVFNPEAIQNKWFFIQICTAYTTFVLIKFSIEKIIANVFSIDKVINDYLYQKLSYRNYLGVLFFIGNLYFLYVYPPTPTGVVIFGCLLLLLNAIALLYSYKKNGNLIFRNFFYFILYLCALEISPYIILYKSFV
tara:strand:- start:135743 stop:136393 length:651 start_codon:yes stop_codon:yes gene_type:complete